MRRALLVLMLAALAACADATPAAPASSAVTRVVSLSPAITETLVELGLRERLVGCTPWCQGVPGIPALGSMTEVDLERLAAARPDIILLQRTAMGAPPGLRETAAKRGWRVEEIACASLSDVRALEGRVADVMGVPESVARAAQWEETLRPIGTLSERSPAVLLLSADPVMAIGNDAFLAQAWAAWGGVTLPATPGYPPMSLEDLFALRPRSILRIGACPASAMLEAACAQRAIHLECIEDGRLLRPGPALREGLVAWRASLETRTP
ncbi:MAG: helical backbone metal receptor [Phycisphaerales bacterium]|jgi:ABC-type hemin transport system substrate-binding protein